MSNREDNSFYASWLYAVPVAIIAVMLFLIGYHIIHRYEGETYSLKDMDKPIAATASETSTAAVPSGSPNVKETDSEEQEEVKKFKPEDVGEKYVNINTASERELMQLPGIGEKTAKRIVEKREKIGRFRRIEDISNVERIGEKTIEAIKPYIVIE